jgi:Ca2+-binding RTX toxin-like protein
VDDLGGTAGNDTIIAAIDGNAESNTLNTGDVIDGGVGTDTLNLTIGANQNPTVTIKNVEVLEVRNAAIGGNVDMRNTDGAVKTIVEKQSTNGFTANFIAAADVAVSIKDVTTASLVSDYNWNTGALSGAADAASLTLNNVVGTAAGRHTVQLQGGTPTQGFETVNVKTEGAASNLANLVVTGSTGATNTMTKLVVTGDQNLTIANTAFAATGGQIDASAFTGNLTVNAVNAVDVDFKGGKGNDTILFGGDLQATDKVDGGEGTDTLGANTFADLQAAFTAGRVSNIEAIRIENAIATANSTLDVSKAGSVNSVSVNGIGANTNAINNLQDNATLTVTAATGGGTLNANIKDATLAGTVNTMTVNLGTATDAAAIAAGTIGAAGVETLNIGSLGTIASGAGTNTVTITGNADLAKMVVTGSEDVTVTFAGGGAALKEFDASAATGVQNTANIDFASSGATIKGGNKADVLVGDAGNDNIVGGAGNDQLFGAGGSDVLTGGEGTDTFFLTTNGNAANATNTIVDSISDFVLGSGNDVIDLSQLANNLRPVLNGTASSTVVSSLVGALPTAATPTTGTAELIILDSSVADMRAADSQALNNKLFNLAGAPNQGQVLVAYSATDGGNVRLAAATIAGGDITNVTDLAVLNGVTTASLASGFNAANLTGFQVNAVYTVAQALAAGNAGLPNGASIVDTGANIAGLTAAQIAGFTNVTSYDANNNVLTLSLDQFNAATNAKLTAGDTVTVADTGVNIAANAAALAAATNVDTVDATDNVLNLSAANAVLLNGKLTAADTNVVLDTNVNIRALTAVQLAGLTNIDTVDASDNVLTTDVAQTAAITNAKLTAADVVTVTDTGANLAAAAGVTVAQFANVDAIDASDNVLNLTVANAALITNAKLTAADVVTLVDTGANIVAAAATTVSFPNVDFVDASDNVINATQAKFAAITNAKLVANDVVTVADTASNLQAGGAVLNSAASVAAATNVDRFDETGDAITLGGDVFNAVLAAGKTFAANDVITLDAAASFTVNAIPATGFGGATSIVLGGMAGTAVTINLANSGKTAISLAGTGNHDVTASAATLETFTVTAAQDGGVVLRGLTSGDIIDLNAQVTHNTNTDALNIHVANAADVNEAGEWHFAGGVLTYAADNAINNTYVAYQIALVGVANIIDSGANQFTVV